MKSSKSFFTFILFSVFFYGLLTKGNSTLLTGKGTEGHLSWDCTTSYCSVASLNDDCSYNGTTLRKNHYYWLGSVSRWECVDSEWQIICSTPGWYFNHNPVAYSENPKGIRCYEQPEECQNERELLKAKCGGSENIAWFNNATCTGECEPDVCEGGKAKKIAECGGEAELKTWNDLTCTGTCRDSCQEKIDKAIKFCDSYDNVAWDETNCSGNCKETPSFNPDNLGEPPCEAGQCCED